MEVMVSRGGGGGGGLQGGGGSGLFFGGEGAPFPNIGPSRLQHADSVYNEQTASTWGRQCLQTADRNSYGPRVNGWGPWVNGVAFGVKCAYSCILEAFGPT